MNQSRLSSLIETLFNTGIGFVVSWLTWPPAAALAGIEYSTSQHWGMTAIFTVVSVARGYVIRRHFNGRLQRAAARMARSLS